MASVVSMARHARLALVVAGSRGRHYWHWCLGTFQQSRPTPADVALAASPTLTAAGFVGRGCVRALAGQGTVRGLYQGSRYWQPAPAPFDWVQGLPQPFGRKDAWRVLGQQWGLVVEGGDPVRRRPNNSWPVSLQQWLGALQLLNRPAVLTLFDKDGKTAYGPAGGLVGPTSRGADWRANPPPLFWLSFHACGEATSARCGKPLRATRASSPMASPAWRSTGWLNSWP